MITQDDPPKALMALTGLSKKGIQFAFRLEDKPGSIKEVTDIIGECSGRMSRILTSCDRVKEVHRKTYIPMNGIDRTKLPTL